MVPPICAARMLSCVYDCDARVLVYVCVWPHGCLYVCALVTWMVVYVHVRVAQMLVNEHVRVTQILVYVHVRVTQRFAYAYAWHWACLFVVLRQRLLLCRLCTVTFLIRKYQWDSSSVTDSYARRDIVLWNLLAKDSFKQRSSLMYLWSWYNGDSVPADDPSGTIAYHPPELAGQGTMAGTDSRWLAYVHHVTLGWPYWNCKRFVLSWRPHPKGVQKLSSIVCACLNVSCPHWAVSASNFVNLTLQWCAIFSTHIKNDSVIPDKGIHYNRVKLYSIVLYGRLWVEVSRPN